MIDTDIQKQVINSQLIDLSKSIEHKELRLMIELAIEAGGKRIRPLLCQIGHGLFHPEVERVLPQALAIELFHTFSLVHDDIMDEAPVRRGQPSIYKRFGRDKAILAGDVKLIIANQLLAKDLTNETLHDVLNCYTKAAIQVCEGQMIDMNFEQSGFPDTQAYLRMIELKTSVLLGASLQIGAIVGGAPKAEQDALHQYGVLQGLAFQIQDDLLDAFGSAQKIGKQVGGDILQGKKTLPTIICASEMSDKGDLLQRLLDDSSLSTTEKIQSVLDLYQSYGVRKKVEKIKNDLFHQATDVLKQLNVNKFYKNKLIELSHWLLNRSY